ncbi:SPOR domain-containing protein [Poseidonocella sp. HB161398]|uniref:SPOR domain-containing protein n=1 Tax=Poseidonocella sp. HB161398 TaxID=2320855 RepID=UPI00110891E4|nr:SPOR domain-containing protein [Poseidonocella sp. HB161398]
MSAARLAGLLALAAAPGWAEPAPEAQPGPDGSYLDAAGCAWRKLEIGGAPYWAMMIGPQGAQLCASLEEAPPPVAAAADGSQEARPSRARSPQFPVPGIYIQVAAFREMENAAQAVIWLRGSGLSALRQDFPRYDGALRVIYAGPFADPEAASAAMAEVRRLGFRDAFVWDRR